MVHYHRLPPTTTVTTTLGAISGFTASSNSTGTIVLSESLLSQRTVRGTMSRATTPLSLIIWVKELVQRLRKDADSMP